MILVLAFAKVLGCLTLPLVKAIDAIACCITTTVTTLVMVVRELVFAFTCVVLLLHARVNLAARLLFMPRMQCWLALVIAATAIVTLVVLRYNSYFCRFSSMY